MGNDNRNTFTPGFGSHQSLDKEVFEAFKDRYDDEKERISHRLTALEAKIEQIASLTSSVEKLAISVETMAKNMEDQNDRLKAIESRDGEMWRKVIAQTAICIIGGLVGFVLAKFGLG